MKYIFEKKTRLKLRKRQGAVAQSSRKGPSKLGDKGEKKKISKGRRKASQKNTHNKTGT